MRTLRIAAGVEAASLVALLGNLLTTHTPAVSALVGPLHGTAYLVVIATAWPVPAAAPSGARWLAVIPGVGGLLALRRIRDRPLGGS
ncbi:hypothetical protein [Streptomyces chryseus]|uniref:DUF3817 domain-containing protein n=1 Tax=Streptomyces chryseus TaxID=68186 RepID=A0ABQ3EFS6_9ACTN|nr:hypothetical protein [Streptomyces chryseus]GHB33341.1 hypothetical protein GCM10010346_65720 [Streptomyces chryseus]